MFEIAGEVVTVTCQSSPSGAGVIAPDLLPIPSNGVPLPPFRGFVTRVGGGACRCSGPLQPTFEPLRKEPARATSLAVRAALPGAFDTRSNAVMCSLLMSKGIAS